MLRKTSLPILPAIALVLLAAACDKGSEASPKGNHEPAAAKPQKDRPETKEAVEPKDDEPKAEVLEVQDGLSTPESVYYHAADDVYLVSNINGTPLDKDDNGYIAKLSPEGKVVEGKWIDGEAEEITLNAPKGMAVFNDTLYVTDIDVVRMFDPKSGEPNGEIEVDGAMFLNDLAAGKDVVYLSDTGVNADFEPTEAAAVHAIDKDGKVTTLAKGKELSGPNGVWPADDGVWVVTFASNELYRIGADGKKADVVTLPGERLDGLIVTEDGTALISSWAAKSVYRGKPSGPFEAVIENVESPADLGWDSKRKRVLIPVFQGNAVQYHPLAG